MCLAIYSDGRKHCRTNVPHAPRSPQYIASLIHRRKKNTNRIANHAIASLTQIQVAFIRYEIYALAGGSSVHLRVDSAVLSLILHCSKHTHADPGWDAAGVDHTTLLDLILASNDLGNQGLFCLISPATPSPPGSRPIRSVRIRPDGGSAPQPDPKLEKALLAVQFVRYFTRDGVVEIFSNKEGRINISSVIKQWIRCITWIEIVVLPRISGLLPQPSIGCLIRVIEKKDGGPACIDIMEHTLRTMRYQAWRRDPELTDVMWMLYGLMKGLFHLTKCYVELVKETNKTGSLGDCLLATTWKSHHSTTQASAKYSHHLYFCVCHSKYEHRRKENILDLMSADNGILDFYVCHSRYEALGHIVSLGAFTLA